MYLQCGYWGFCVPVDDAALRDLWADVREQLAAGVQFAAPSGYKYATDPRQWFAAHFLDCGMSRDEALDAIDPDSRRTDAESGFAERERKRAAGTVPFGATVYEMDDSRRADPRGQSIGSDRGIIPFHIGWPSSASGGPTSTPPSFVLPSPESGVSACDACAIAFGAVILITAGTRATAMPSFLAISRRVKWRI